MNVNLFNKQIQHSFKMKPNLPKANKTTQQF